LWGSSVAGSAICGRRNDLLAKLQTYQGLGCHLLLKADAWLHTQDSMVTAFLSLNYSDVMTKFVKTKMEL